MARPLKLAELAGYQDHSVVSREIIRKSTGTVTVFAFDAGEGLSEHIAPFDALVYCLEGKGEVMIARTWHPVKAGERFKMLLVLVK